jgi:transposase
MDKDASEALLKTGHNQTIIANTLVVHKSTVSRGRADFQSTIRANDWKGYGGRVGLGYEKHHRVQHDDKEFVNSKSHFNGIENFWCITKMRLTRFRGLSKATFYLNLKECDFRFNRRERNF